jgi:glutamate-1-semialdehyde aminotransferase
MKKSAFNYNVDKETADDFAVVPFEDLQAVAMLVHVIGKQIAVLDTMLENMGVTQYSFEKKIKTLADVKATSTYVNKATTE